MTESTQELLKKAWLGGRVGNMSPLSEARAWALAQVWQDDGKPDYGMHKYIAGKVTKVGGGRPTNSAIRQFLEKVDADPERYPGKCLREKFGPSSVITPTNQAIVARSAMAMKERGEEPTYASIVANNPQALLNPETGEVVSKKRVYAILEERCYDDPENPEDTWTNRVRMSKAALPEPAKRLRLDWAVDLQSKNHRSSWFFNNLVWTDICNTILARTEKRHKEMTLARKGKRGWGSEETQLQSNSLRGKKETLKQKSYDGVRVYWAPILARGKFHIELLGEDFPGEAPQGAAILVARVRAALNVRFQGDDESPAILFTDRGQGFHHIKNGRITPEYQGALREHGLRTFYGDDASAQPGNLQEVMLHEPAVAWIRKRETVTQTRQPWTETVAEFGARLRGICRHINSKYDVEGLCKELPQRLQSVVGSEGDRISK